MDLHDEDDDDEDGQSEFTSSLLNPIIPMQTVTDRPNPSLHPSGLHPHHPHPHRLSFVQPDNKSPVSVVYLELFLAPGSMP